MDIAYTTAPGKGDTDLLMEQVATALEADGHRLAGTVQINSDTCGTGLCDMDVRVLSVGKIIRISQTLGRESRGCRLDPAALEEAVGLVEASLEGPVQALIVNKFGKHEAEGRGFRNAIALALSKDLPVLVGINALNIDAFQEFVGGDAQGLAPDVEAIRSWLAPKLKS